MYFRIMIQSSFQSVIMWLAYIAMYVVSFGTLLWTYRSIGKISYYLGNVIYLCVLHEVNLPMDTDMYLQNIMASYGLNNRV